MTDAEQERLQDLWAASREAWPGVEISAKEFQRFVDQRLEPSGDATALDRLHLTDLYLACACALRVAGALETFERVYLAHVPRFVARLDRGGQLAEDIRQTLRERLFVGSAAAPARIADYEGRGPLLAWLRVAAVRSALDVLRERDARAEVELDEAELVDRLAGQRDADDDLVKAQYRREFEASVAEALRSLPRRERNLLRLHLVGRVSTAKLGAMFHVDQSTVVRWLAGARQVVREAVRTRLLVQLGLSPAEVDSLAGLLLSGLDLSLAGCLRSQPE